MPNFIFACAFAYYYYLYKPFYGNERLHAQINRQRQNETTQRTYKKMIKTMTKYICIYTIQYHSHSLLYFHIANFFPHFSFHFNVMCVRVFFSFVAVESVNITLLFLNFFYFALSLLFVCLFFFLSIIISPALRIYYQHKNNMVVLKSKKLQW